MAVTTQTSTELTNILSATPTTYEASAYGGELRFIPFTFTQAGAGDSTSVIDLAKLPAGNITLIGGLSKIYNSALGTSAVLDIGYTAYVEPDDTSVTASETAFGTDLAVATAGSVAIDDGLGMSGSRIALNSKNGVTVRAKVKAAAIPSGATLNGYLVYSAG